MTKRVSTGSIVDVRINETELAAMELVGLSSLPKKVSSAELARELDCSVATVRNVLRSLKAKELLSSKSRFLQNGGQLENEYSLTGKGRRVLRAAREAARDASRPVSPS